MKFFKNPSKMIQLWDQPALHIISADIPVALMILRVLQLKLLNLWTVRAMITLFSVLLWATVSFLHTNFQWPPGQHVTLKVGMTSSIILYKLRLRYYRKVQYSVMWPSHVLCKSNIGCCGDSTLVERKYSRMMDSRLSYKHVKSIHTSRFLRNCGSSNWIVLRSLWVWKQSPMHCLTYLTLSSHCKYSQFQCLTGRISIQKILLHAAVQ